MRFSSEQRGKSLAPNFYSHTIQDYQLDHTIDDLKDQASLFTDGGGTKAQRKQAYEAELKAISEIRRSTKAHNSAHQEFVKWDEELEAYGRAAESVPANPILKARIEVYERSMENVVKDNIEAVKGRRDVAQQDIIKTNAALVSDLQESHVFE